jgi:hypothetical protein
VKLRKPAHPSQRPVKPGTPNIADLVDQHRTARELDDSHLGEIIRLFYEAQSACSALRFKEGLAIYEAIPIGSVANRRLR